MNKTQEKFFTYMSQIQKTCVSACMAKHNTKDTETEKMLYEVTYDVISEVMTLIDGYTNYSPHKHDIVDTVTQERLKDNPFIELHDVIEDYLKCE